ncbi:hypothetical protein OIU74_006554 [Salix koriyanagi]|uniref:Uncharacterized protein n=1 Tax=Salix koriyanagi TaxID=2511006 RepID=A0A9Q0ZBL8_9ROSI|nr:hypothetical protein OIU74_006554 [Salix koriyanagi]
MVLTSQSNELPFNENDSQDMVIYQMINEAGAPNSSSTYNILPRSQINTPSMLQPARTVIAKEALPRREASAMGQICCRNSRLHKTRGSDMAWHLRNG